MAAEEGAVIACHTKDEFDARMAKAKEQGKLVVIDFMAPWCSGCQMMAPVYADCASKYPSAVFLEVDVDELLEVAKIYGVHVMPTFCFIRNGETLESFATVDEGELRDAVRKYAAAAAGTTTAPASASA
uniref:Thioredoxin n=1 Tax=Zea mays TaxID=4577 RepID=I2EBS7_MAIZE|nr:thioredoxin [Zea mays]